MKKILSIILILTLAVLSFVYNEISLVDIVSNARVEYEIIEDEKDNQVIKIPSGDYDKVVDNLNMEIVDKVDISDRTIIEGYSSCLSDYVIINNRKINIQISISDDLILVGYPLIKNSF